MSVISSDLQPKLNNSLKVGTIHASQITGRSQFTSSLGAQVFSPGTTGVMEFTIQPSGFVDLPTIRLEGIIAYKQGLRLTRSIQSVIDRLEIYFPTTGEHVCDIQDFNCLQTALSDVTFTPMEMEAGSLAITQLYGSDSLREQYGGGSSNSGTTGDNGGTSFSMQLNHDLFKMTSFMPAFLTGGMKIRVTLATGEKAMIRVDNSLTDSLYYVSNLVCSYDVVSVTPQVTQNYINAYNNNSLQIKCPTWRVSRQTSSAQIENIRITNTANSNRALLMVPRYQGVINSATQDSLGRRTAASLRQLTVKIGDAVARVHDTTHGAASLVALLQQAIDFTSTSTCINALNYHSALPFTAGSQADLDRSSKFMVLESLELDNTDSSVLSGISRQDISINLDYKNPLADAIVYTSFILVDQIISIGKDVQVKILS